MTERAPWMREPKMYKATTYGNFELNLPDFNWGVSVSVDVFNFEDRAPYRVFWQTEPNDVINYEEKLIRNHEFYDLILCWNARILSECENAKLFPIGAVWYSDPDTSQKKFQASFLTSSKNLTYGHQFRQDIFNALPDAPLSYPQFASKHGISEQEVEKRFRYLRFLPILKHKSPPYLATKRDLLVPCQYTIVVENGQHVNFFSEKINDACATKTIPIYWGAPNVGTFYNKDAILSFNSTQELFDILNGLTPEFYATKQAAIEENYNTALTYADRTGNIAKSIIESWAPKIKKHDGGPNVPPQG
jgi:hypothetical protein